VENDKMAKRCMYQKGGQKGLRKENESRRESTKSRKSYHQGVKLIADMAKCGRQMIRIQEK